MSIGPVTLITATRNPQALRMVSMPPQQQSASGALKVPLARLRRTICSHLPACAFAMCNPIAAVFSTTQAISTCQCSAHYAIRPGSDIRLPAVTSECGNEPSKLPCQLVMFQSMLNNDQFETSSHPFCL